MAGLRQYFNFEHPTFEGYLLETIDSILSVSRKLILAGAIYQHGPTFVRQRLVHLIPVLGLRIAQWSVKSWPVVELIFNDLSWRVRGGAISYVNSPEAPPCVKPALEDCAFGTIVISSFFLGKYISIPLRKIHPSASLFVASAFTIYHFCEGIFPNSSTTRLLTEAITRFAITPARQDLRQRKNILSLSFLDSESKHPLYQYQGLCTDHSIRLIRLGIDPVKPHSIQCRLMEVDINDPPPYRALSCCWGSSVKEHGIILGDGTDTKTRIPITKSAFDALMDLTPLEHSCYIWIDAICINQASIPEKNLQIPLMTKIYSSATEVVVNLGTSPDAALAVSFINRMYFHEQLKNSSAVSEFLAKDNYDFGLLLGKSALSFRHDRLSLKAWVTLQGNDYWSRAWVLQECAVAKRIVAVYGGVYIAWPLIMFSAGMLSEAEPLRIRLQDENLSDVVTNLASSNLQMMMKLMNLGLEYAKNGLSRSLVEVITDLRNSKATEGQDKVFDFLGLSKDFETFPLRPDYSADLLEVFGSVVKHALENDQFLSFCMSGLESQAEGQSSTSSPTTMPSWMPDLVKPSTIGTSHYHERGYTAGINTQDSPAFFEISPQWFVLKLQGVHVDTIMARSSSSQLTDLDFMRISDFPTTGLEGLLRLLEAKSLFDKHIASDDLEKIERQFAFWSTISDDFDGRAFEDDEHLLQVLESLESSLSLISSMFEDASLGGKDASELPQNPKDQAGKLIESLAKSSDVLLSEYTLDNLMKLGAISEFSNLILQDAMVMSMHSIMARAFVLTENKRVALVPQEAQVNDIIVVPDGSPVPHVLRLLDSSNSSYLFVGEAYVHGCMDGETMKHDRSWFSLH